MKQENTKRREHSVWPWRQGSSPAPTTNGRTSSGCAGRSLLTAYWRGYFQSEARRSIRGSSRAFGVVLVVSSYISWKRFRDVPPPRSGKIMLAVLPFQNLTGDPKEEYLADGLTEQMISQLGRLHPEQLGVIGRTSVMGYKHSDQRLDQIGRELSAQYVLENSLRGSGDHLRVTIQLLQVKDQNHLWAQDYDYRSRDTLILEV